MEKECLWRYGFIEAEPCPALLNFWTPELLNFFRQGAWAARHGGLPKHLGG